MTIQIAGAVSNGDLQISDIVAMSGKIKVKRVRKHTGHLIEAQNAQQLDEVNNIFISGKGKNQMTLSVYARPESYAR